jgi:DNA-binding transcriptional LysR family regulator
VSERAAAPRFTLDQLVVLEAIVRTGSFAAAARELHRVASAVSYTVQGLEEALGVALFDRSGHRAVLTAAGRQLVEEARDVLQRARKLDRLALTLADGWEPEVRLVVDGAYPMDPVLRALRVFAERGVPTQVRIDVEYQDGVLDRFEADHADVMIALGLEDGGRLKGAPLPPLEMVLVVASVHPLANVHGIGRDALAAHVDLVVRDSSPAYARTPRRTFLGTQHVVRFSDFHSKRAALLVGVGFGWMPLHLVADDLASGALVLIDLPDGNRWTYQPQLITRRDEPPGRAAALLMDVVAEVRQQS